jgi:hypothetical protein
MKKMNNGEFKNIGKVPVYYEAIKLHFNSNKKRQEQLQHANNGTIP